MSNPVSIDLGSSDLWTALGASAAIIGGSVAGYVDRDTKRQDTPAFLPYAAAATSAGGWAGLAYVLRESTMGNDTAVALAGTTAVLSALDLSNAVRDQIAPGNDMANKAVSVAAGLTGAGTMLATAFSGPMAALNGSAQKTLAEFGAGLVASQLALVGVHRAMFEEVDSAALLSKAPSAISMELLNNVGLVASTAGWISFAAALAL